MIELSSESDFKWYKAKLDLERKHEHRHFGVPTHYPCRVTSNYENGWEDFLPRGNDVYEHSFIYKRWLRCSECGHETSTWDQPTEVKQ